VIHPADDGGCSIAGSAAASSLALLALVLGLSVALGARRRR
jgi:Ca2+/H+ antiporter